MSVDAVARKFVEMCNQGRNFEVMRTMYAPDIVSVEGNGEATAGQAAVIHKSEVRQETHEIHAQKVRGPYFNGNQFAAQFTFELTRKGTGMRITFEEVALYTVEGDQITREQFFYDGEL